MVWKPLILLTVFLVAGCIAAAPPSPIPSPTATPAQTPAPAPEPVIVQLVSVPASTTLNQSLSVSWNVSGGEKGEITRTSIHWGTNPGKAAKDYAEETAILRGRTPATFNAEIRAASHPGAMYLRAFAVVDGREYHSDERTVKVEGVVQMPPPPATPDALAVERGAQIFEIQGCTGCHYADKESLFEERNRKMNWLVGPGLKGLFKKDRLPATGRPATEENVRRQINNGGGGMPSFAALGTGQIDDLIAYLKTL